jgi:hypothetical protein
MEPRSYKQESTCNGTRREDRERDNTTEEKEPQEGKERKKKRGKGKGKTEGERLRWREIKRPPAGQPSAGQRRRRIA